MARTAALTRGEERRLPATEPVDSQVAHRPRRRPERPRCSLVDAVDGERPVVRVSGDAQLAQGVA